MTERAWLLRRLPLMSLQLAQAFHVARPRCHYSPLCNVADRLSGRLNLPQASRLDAVFDGAGGAVRREDYAALAVPDVGRINLRAGLHRPGAAK